MNRPNTLLHKLPTQTPLANKVLNVRVLQMPAAGLCPNCCARLNFIMWPLVKALLCALRPMRQKGPNVRCMPGTKTGFVAFRVELWVWGGSRCYLQGVHRVRLTKCACVWQAGPAEIISYREFLPGDNQNQETLPFVDLALVQYIPSDLQGGGQPDGTPAGTTPNALQSLLGAFIQWQAAVNATMRARGLGTDLQPPPRECDDLP